MNMISTGTFQSEMDASNKQDTLVSKLVAAWEKKNAKVARAGGVSLMALSLAACGSDDDTTTATTTDTTTDTTTTTPVVTTPVNQNIVFLKDTIDILAGGDGDDTFTGDNGTTTAADTANGGAGTDTLKLYGNVAEPQMSGIEAIYLNGNTAGFDFADNTGVTSVTLDNVASAQTYTIAAGQGVTIKNMAAGEVVDLDGNTVVTGTVTLDDVAAAGADVTLDLNSTKQTGVTLDVTSESQLTLANTGAALASVSITGAGKLEFGHALASLTTIDASAATGNITVDAVATNILTFTGGSGDDSIAMAGTVASTDTLDGGAGSDTLKATGTTATFGSTAAAIKATNFETLELTAEASGAIDLDVFSTPTAFANVTVVSGVDNDDMTLTDFQGTSVTVKNSAGTAGEDFGNLVIDPKDYSGADDSVSVTFSNMQTGATNSTDVMGVNQLTLTGIETLNLATTHKSATGTAEDITVANATWASLKTVNISGTADLTLPAFGATTTVVDGNAATGALSITLGAADTTVTGGSGADTFAYTTTFTGDDTLDGGAGIDTMTITGANTSTDVEATNVEKLKATSTATSTESDTFDLDKMATLTHITADFASTPGDLKFEDVSATLTNIIVDGGATVGAATLLQVDLDKDTTADTVTITFNNDGTGYEGDVTMNDFETITLNIAYASAGSVTAADIDDIDDITVTDASTIAINTTGVTGYQRGDDVLLGTLNASANVTLDLTGFSLELGNTDGAEIRANKTIASNDALISKSTIADYDEGITLTAGDAVTVKIDDDRTSTNDLLVIDIDGNETDHTAGDAGALSDANIDIIQFVDDGTNTNDIGFVVLEHFQDRTNYSAATADKIDLAGLNVASISELTFTDTDSTIDGALISSKAGSDGTATGNDFDGFIYLVGVDHTHLTADNFVFG
jgi:hypothetical protein